MDGMVSETQENGVLGTNDQGAPVTGTEGASVDVGNDDGCGVAPATVVCVANLLGDYGAPSKHRRINGDMASALDRFAKSSTRIKQMKMEIMIQLITRNWRWTFSNLNKQQQSVWQHYLQMLFVVLTVARGVAKVMSKSEKLSENFLYMQ
jgi:hypothetical protein